MPYYYKEINFAWIDLKELIDSQADMNYQSCEIKNEELWFNSKVKGYDGNMRYCFLKDGLMQVSCKSKIWWKIRNVFL